MYIFEVILIVRWNREVILNWKETSCIPLVRPGFEAGRLRHLLTSRLNGWSQTDRAIEDQANESLDSTAHPYDEQVFSPLNATAGIG